MSTQVTGAYEYAGNGPCYKVWINCSHNIIFSMLKLYYYPVNPLCAMAAQGMKTVYADPWNTSM
jgi:hypothetical protein